MKPAPFEYIAPESVEETLEVLTQYGDEAKILAGGQSLMPLLNMRLTTATVLVDINGLEDLNYIRQEGDYLQIGALTRQYRLEHDPLIQQAVPILAPVTRLIGHPPIRYAGTIGGSLAHADPAAELPAAVCALEAELHVSGLSGSRWVQSGDFSRGYLTVDMQPAEMLTEVRFPVRKNAAWGVQEYTRRAGDFALAGAIVLAEIDAGQCKRGRIVVFGVGDRPVRAVQAERLIIGRALSRDMADDVASTAVDGLDCQADLHASAEYRKHLARVMVKRAYVDAVTMWESQTD